MSGLPLACVLFLVYTYGTGSLLALQIFAPLFTKGGAGAYSPADAIKSHLGCTEAPHVNSCVKTKLSDLLNLGRFYLVTVAKKRYGGVGSGKKITGITFAAKTKGPLSVSGSGINVIGLDTIHIKQATLYKNVLKLTLVLPKLVVRGHFQVKFPPLSQKFTVEMDIVNLKVMAAATFGRKHKKLVVKNVKVAMNAEKIRVKVYKNSLLNALISHWVNDKALNSKTLPWLSKILEGQLKKILQKYVTRIK